MSRRRDKCASSEGGIIRGYAAWAQLRESGETGRRAGLRIQWAKSPWGFDSPLSHQHRDRLRGRSRVCESPARSPRTGYLMRLNLVVVGVRPLARVNISRVSLLTIFMSRGSAFPLQGCRIPESLPSLMVPSNQTPEQVPLLSVYDSFHEPRTFIPSCSTTTTLAAADAPLPGEGRRLCASAWARGAVVAVAAFPPAAGECWRVPSRCLCSGRPPLEPSRGRRPRTRERRHCRPLLQSFAADP